MRGKYIALLTAILFSLTQVFNTMAAELKEPASYEPGFFDNKTLPGITINDVVLNEDGYIVAVYDEALIREGISVDSVGIFVLENSSSIPSAEIISFSGPVVGSPISPNRWGISLSDYDREIVAKIVYLEANNQGDVGQQAVVEVILNRVYSPIYPNTVLGVLSQRKQFSTWPYVERGIPDARIYANIDAVIQGQTNILPYNTLYFSTRPFKGKVVQAKIQDHYFCNE